MLELAPHIQAGCHNKDDKIRFTCIGFDVKQWPPRDLVGIDETSWESNSIVYSEIVESFNVSENEYQLLDIQDARTFELVGDYIKSCLDGNLVAVELPTSIVELNNSRYGYTTGLRSVDLSSLYFLGFDVCDMNGLFSILHHSSVVNMRSRKGLIHRDELQKALEVVQIANILDKGHSPFVVAKLLSLKRW